MTTAITKTNGTALSASSRFTSDQVGLITRTIAKGATPDELAGMIGSCTRGGTGVTARLDIPAWALRRLYVDLGLSTLEIGRLLGCAKKTVRLRLVDAGIARRSLADAFALSATHQRNNPRTGDRCNWWRGGRRIKVGYLQVLMRDHPEAVDGYVFMHRLIASESIGRPLLPGEEVHHINGDKLDNRPENLQVMSKGAHMALHMREKRADGRIGRRQGVHQ